MKIIKKICLMLCILFCFLFCVWVSGCNNMFEAIYGSADSINLNKENEDIEAPDQILVDERQWTILVYMCGDNNLEAAAVEDLCEMEFSNLDTDKVTVLALVDRNPAFDTSYDNWSGTRLYKIKTGKTADSRQLISTEIECRDLGLVVGEENELDMSSGYTLSYAVSYARKRFPANHYGLIMWGHGTGWRGEKEDESYDELEEALPGVKGFSYDSTSGTYMTLYQMGTALKNGINDWPFDFIGFDTCYGAELEVLVELAPYAKFIAGSEGLISTSGWNYRELFDLFQSVKNKSAENLTECVIKQFQNQYSYKNRASIVAVKTDEIDSFFNSADAFWFECGKAIDSMSVRDDVMSLLFSGKECKTQRYSYGTGGSDVYLDVVSMIEELNSYFKNVSGFNKKLFTDFSNAASCFITGSWASDRTCGGIGVYFGTLQDGLNLGTTHPGAYIKNRTADQIKFVEKSIGYVPCDKTGESLLDKLFYTNY